MVVLLVIVMVRVMGAVLVRDKVVIKVVLMMMVMVVVNFEHLILIRGLLLEAKAKALISTIFCLDNILLRF